MNMLPSKLKANNRFASKVFGGKLSNAFVLFFIVGTILFLVAILIENIVALNGWSIALYIGSVIVYIPALREYNIHVPE